MPKSAYFGIRPAGAGDSLKPVEWIGGSLDDLQGLPAEPRRVFGHAIHLAQLGLHHGAAKLLQGEFRGLVEVVNDFDGNTFRAVYTVKLAGAVYVLHVFQKKSKRGIATPRRELVVIRGRLRRAQAHHATHFTGETGAR